MLAVLQANVGRGAIVTSQLIKFADQEKIDIIMMQEPHTRDDRVVVSSNEFTVLESNQAQPTSHSKSQQSASDQQHPQSTNQQHPQSTNQQHPQSTNQQHPQSTLGRNHLSSPHRPKAACLIRNNVTNYLFDREISNVNMIVVAFDHIILVSMYSNSKNPDKSDRPMKDDLRSIDKVLEKYSSKKIAIFMDSNCHHVTVGGEANDERGEDLIEFLRERDLICANRSEQGATYSKIVNGKKQETYIDWTLMNKKMSDQLHSWTIEREAMSTEHAAIVSRFKSGRMREAKTVRQLIDYEGTDWDAFFEIYNDRKPKQFGPKKFERKFEKFDKAIRRAFNKCVKVREKVFYDSIPWFDEQLEEMQKQIMNKRRRLSRLSSDSSTREARGELSELNREFAKRVQDSKKKFYSKQNEEITGSEQFWKAFGSSKPYEPTNIPMFPTNRKGTIKENTRILADQFVKPPARPYIKQKIRSKHKQLRATDQDELGRAIAALNNNKAPGLDRVTNKLIKIIFDRDKEYITKMFNMLLETGRIPATWKCGRMIFFRKPGKDPREPKSYRPITLISGWCKLAERLFIERIEEDLSEKNFFSKSQYGFRRGVSTIDAIEKLIKIIKKKRKSRENVVLVVAIDISGAFDAISWSSIVRNLINAHCSDAVVNACENLLIDRRIDINGLIFHSKKGTPQGGRASPALFRIGLNGLLSKLNEHGIDHVAYADDLALVLDATSQSRLQEKLSNAFELIRSWCKEADLTVNEQKTELMLTTRKRSMKWKLHLNEKEARITDHFKYLGVVVDKKLTWREHIAYLDKKISIMLDRIRKFSWMQFDLEWRLKRKLYFSVFLPTLTYASAIWFSDLANRANYLDRLRGIQRRFVIAATGAYKCTPNERLMKLLGLIDVVDELRMLCETRERSAPERKAMKYRKRTETIERMQGFEVAAPKFDADLISNKHTIWCISECGPFKKFLHRIGKSDDDWCRYCCAASESSSHLIFECEALGDSLTSELEMSELNSKCKELVRKLQRDAWRV